MIFLAPNFAKRNSKVRRDQVFFCVFPSVYFRGKNYNPRELTMQRVVCANPFPWVFEDSKCSHSISSVTLSIPGVSVWGEFGLVDSS